MNERMEGVSRLPQGCINKEMAEAQRKKVQVIFMGIKCKLVEKVGWRSYLRVYWHGKDQKTGESLLNHPLGIHNAETFLKDYIQKEQPDAIEDLTKQEEVDEYKGQWPVKCDSCNEQVPPFFYDKGKEWEEYPHYQIYMEHLYDDPPRPLQAGDMYWAPWMGTKLDPRGHLLVVIPGQGSAGARIWDTMGVASNCTHPDKTNDSHYCWVRTGEPPNCTIRPSILQGEYHGFMTNGELSPV